LIVEIPRIKGIGDFRESLAAIGGALFCLLARMRVIKEMFKNKKTIYNHENLVVIWKKQPWISASLFSSCELLSSPNSSC